MTKKEMVNYHKNEMSKFRLKQRIKALTAAPRILNTVQSKSIYDSIRKIMRMYLGQKNVALPSAKDAVCIRNNIDVSTLINDNGQELNYIACVPQHDPTADKVSNGYWRPVRLSKHRSAHCWGIYIEDREQKYIFRNKSLEIIFEEIFAFETLTDF
eukprot:344133_1